MANGGTIRFGVGFDVDTTSLQNVRTQLSELTKMSLSPSFKEEFKGTSEELSKITNTLRTVNQLYDEAFDSTTGMVNTEKFTAALSKQELTIRDISETYSKMGAQGTKAFNSLYSQLTKTNLKFKETNNFLTKMGETLTNTIKWSISSSLINNFTNSIQQAWGYVQHLDTSLNDIRIVTGKTSDEMADFAVKANEAASSLGAATTEYTEAALIYYQQGLSDDEANARAETTIKAANVTGQTGREVSEELTAVWNGYKVTAEETELYVDKLAAVAATTASDLEELSTGMSKVASAANNMGVDIDQLNAQLSTIISVTRQAPETAGTALKTIYARMEDLKINGEDEDGVKLGEVSSTLDEVGVHVMDTAGNLRDLGEVIEEVGNKWETWTNAQQSAIAQAIAGKRQYNNLLALFDNWDMYNSALETSANATGTLQNQQDIYMESTAAHIQKLKTEWEDLYDSLIDTDDINTIIDGVTKIIDKFTSLIDIIGGGKTALMGIIALLGQIPGISSAISNQFGGIISKSLNAKMNAQLWANYIDNVKANYSDVNKQAQSQYEILQQVEKYNSILTDEQKEQVINHGKIISSLEGEKQVLEQELSDVKQLAEETAKVIIDQDPETGEDTGAYNLLNGDSQFYSVSGQKTDYEDMFDAQEQAIQDADIALEDYINSIETYIEKQEEIPKAEEYTDIYGQSIGNSALEYEQQIETVKESVQDLQSSLSKPLQLLEKTAPQEFEKVNKALKETTELIQSGETDSEKIRESYEKLRTTATQAFEQAGVKITDFREKLGSLGPKIAETSQKLTEAKQKFEEFLNDLASNAIGEGITKITGSLAGFAYGVQSIQSLGSIWNNADVGLGQKLLSTITSLSLALPMLSSSFTKIKEGLTSLNIGLSGSITQLLKYGSTEELISLAQANFSRLTQEQITELGLSEVEWDRETAAVVLDTLAKEGNIGTTTTLGNLLKTKLLTGLESAKTGFKTLATTIGLSTGALTALLVVIGLVAAAFIGYYNHLKSVREAEASAAEARAEAAKEYTDSLEEEKTKVDELVSSYKSLKEQYEDHSISLQTLREEVYDLAIQYGYEDLALQALTDSYESLTKAMAEYQTQANKELIEAQNKEKDSLKDKIGSSIWRDADETARDEIVTYELDENGNSIAKQTKTLDLKGFGVRNKDEEELARGLQDLGINVYDNGHIDYEQFIEVLTENRDELQAVINKSSSEAAAQLQGYIDNASADLDRYEELTESVLTEEEQNRGLMLEQLDVESYEDAQKAYQEYMKTATEVDGLTWKEAQEQFIQYANTMDNTFMQEEAKRQLLKDKMESEYLAAANANNIDTSDWDIHEQTDQFIDELVKSGFSLDDISLITEEQWHKLYLGELNLEDIKAELEEETRQNLEQIRNDFLNNDVGQFNIDLNSVISDMVSGDLSSDDETYVALSEQLESIKEAFPELTDEATIFLQEGLIGTEAWAQAAYSLQDAFDQLELERLNDNFKDELEDITPELDTSTFKTQMEELLDADYEISVKVYSDGIEEFENAEAALDDIDEMASKIGDDFIVAADDIRELNNTFPGILDGMTYLADGTVQLNEEMVQSAMSMATEEELASTDATATKLENTAAELRAKADVYENMAELAYQAANDEIDAEDAKSDIIEQLDQLEADNDEEVSNTEIDNSNLVADVSASDAQTLATNWTQAYQDAATAANDWADVAVAAQDYVESGGETSKSDFQTSVSLNKYSGSTATGATASSASLSSMDADDIDWTTLGDELSAQAEAYRSSANDLEGAAAELRAKSISSANTNADAADGTSDDDDSSSSSSSEDEADTEEYLEREEDLYRAINEQLDDIESKLGRIDTIESHSWGADYLDTLEEENELLTAQLDLLETKKSTYESDLSSQQSTLSSYGITFSEDGSVMTNAEDVLDSLYSEYNSMVDSYNSMSADAQDDYQDTLDSQKDYIDSIEDAIDSYEDAYSEYNSVLDDLLDTHYELIENAVNQFNTTIDVHLELDEAETEWNEFWYEVVQDVQDTDFSGLFEESIAKLTTLVGTTGNTSSSQVAELTTHLNDTITEVQKQIAGADIGGGDSIFGDDTALSKETLETYRDSLIDAVTSAKEEIDTMQENYLKALDDAQDKIDEQVEGWEAVGDHIEHNIELIQMVSGSKAFEPLNKQFEQQYQNNLNLIETQKISQDYWKERMEYYERMMATEEEGSQMYQTYSDALEKASENYRSAVKDLDSAVKQALDDLEEWRKNQVSALEDTLDKALSSGMGLDDMQSEWDLILEKQGMYLDNVERALEMQDLEKDFSDVLDTLTARNDLQQEFLKFQDEELSKLQNKNKLTQYDIDEVRARLEIRKAELALEEAQQNKSNLRLRRDSQGNYTYQYTANAEDTEDAEDGIVSAKREWYELVKKRQEEVAENAIDIGKRIKEAWSEYEQALEDEDQVRADNAKARYDELIAYEKDMMQEAEKAKQDFYQGTADFFADVNNNNILPIWDTTIEGMINKWSDGGETSFVGAVGQGITDLDNLQQDFSDKTTEILTTAGVNYENLVNDGIDPTTEALEDMNDTNEELNETLDETNSLLDTLESELQDAISAYDSLKDAAVSAIEEANEALNTLSNTVITSTQSATSTANSLAGTSSSSSSGSSSSSSSSSSGSGTSSSSSGDKYYLRKGNSTSTYGSSYGASDYQIVDSSGKVQSGTNGITITEAINWKKKYNKDVEGLATGGYTGEWTNGSEDGRLAFLHQKELVLNESDTENILNAVTAVRDLVGSQGSQTIDIEGISNSIIRSGYITAQVLAQVGTNMLQAIASMVNNSNSEVQNYRNMTVNADFSGVRSADAIYQALMDLDNYGSQQAYSNAPDMNVRY